MVSRPSRSEQPSFDFEPDFFIDQTDGLLSLQGKLKVLADDPRAGFMPTTHAEKNFGCTLIDYLDDPRYPAKTANALQEVMIHQRPYTDIPGARRSLISIVLEYGDFVTNALKEGEALTTLAAGVAACPNPNVTLAAELGEEHPGFAALTRYVDLSQIRATGSLPEVTYDPLHTHENRQIHASGQRNKIVEDPYTGEEVIDAVQQRIYDLAHSFTIGEARKIVPTAVIDQQRRARFWTDRIKESKAHGAVTRIAKQLLADLEVPSQGPTE